MPHLTIVTKCICHVSEIKAEFIYLSLLLYLYTNLLDSQSIRSDKAGQVAASLREARPDKRGVHSCPRGRGPASLPDVSRVVPVCGGCARSTSFEPKFIYYKLSNRKYAGRNLVMRSCLGLSYEVPEMPFYCVRRSNRTLYFILNLLWFEPVIFDIIT